MYIPFLEVCTCITGYNRFINFYKIIKATPKQIKRKRKIDRGIMKELIALCILLLFILCYPFSFPLLFFFIWMPLYCFHIRAYQISPWLFCILYVVLHYSFLICVNFYFFLLYSYLFFTYHYTYLYYKREFDYAKNDRSAFNEDEYKLCAFNVALWR